MRRLLIYSSITLLHQKGVSMWPAFKALKVKSTHWWNLSYSQSSESPIFTVHLIQRFWVRVACFNSTIKRQSMYNKVNVIYARILIMRSCRVVYPLVIYFRHFLYNCLWSDVHTAYKFQFLNWRKSEKDFCDRLSQKNIQWTLISVKLCVLCFFPSG